MASKSTTRSKSTRPAKCRCGERPDCGPSCTGLECLERPRFFSGQLLTESELNSLEQYVLAKNRLHNLHHHGWGVVCGLEVTCHECDGWVTVHPGYAIDSCGNDVVVCKPDDFNVMEEIRRCKEARKKDDCYCPPGRKDCDEDREEHWCLTLSYLEKEARPTTALNQEPQRCGCSCGTAGKTERVKAGVGKAPYACEPSRILECYRLELCESEEGACRGRLSSGEQAWLDKFKACYDNLVRSLRSFPRQEAMNLGSGLLVRAGVSSFTTESAERQPAEVYRDYRRVYDFLRELFRRNPGNLHCAWIDRLEELEDPVPGANDNPSSYGARIEKPASSLMSYLLLYLIDCFCHAMLPPCAPCCPGEDPLVLACMKIRNGKILEICNYSCRRYAGVFPPSLYGVYLGPFLPFLTRIMEIFCCGDFVERLLGQLRTQEWARKLGSFVTADRFANVRSVDFQARNLWAALNRKDPEAEKQVRLSRFVGRETEIVIREAREAGVEVTMREVKAVPLAARVRTLSAARPGERLVAFSQEGKIVGFAAEGSTEAALVEQADELATLRSEIESLKGRSGAGSNKK
ncbi:MAG TPA: hypothetical protein VLT87_27555 [Thermoanaerobaculia bacterium]|nr:hypothetical protein [Thermoanaerobaculia bacterium]